MSKVNKNATEHEFVTPDEEPAAKNNETKAEQIEVMFGALESRAADVKAKFNTNENYSLKEPLLLAHFKSFRYSDGEQPFCL